MTCLDYTAPEGASPLVEQKPYMPYNRRLIYGVGRNDYPTPTHVNGKDLRSYSIWCGVLERCYSAKFQQSRPTYAGCSVVKEWLSFTTFEKWFTDSYVEGWKLDKDILVPGNRVYGPETCVFVTQALNSLLLDCRVARGKYPLGVCFHKATQKYTATIHTGAGQRHLGCFTTPLAAHQAWQLAKSAHIKAAETCNPRVRAALDLRVVKLSDDRANGRITTKL